MISSQSNHWCVKLVSRLKGGINDSLCGDEISLRFRKRHFVVKNYLIVINIALLVSLHHCKQLSILNT